MHVSLRPLLPAQGGFRNTPPQPPKRPKKRRIVPLACEPCRKRKTRCDGIQPECKPCHERQVRCVYAADGPAALRIAKLRSRNELLQSENGRLWELFRLLGTLPSDQVDGLIQTIRAADQPDAVLRLARDSSPSTRDSRSPDMVPAEPLRDNPRLLAMDLRALANSRLRVPSRPWTVVASDGVVSDLISSFFAWDDPFFFPFIDRDAFLQDMRARDVERATYCSPFLVNAICASRYVSIRASRHVHHQTLLKQKINMLLVHFAHSESIWRVV